MDLSDPLSDYRVGEASSADELELFLDQQGIPDATVWRRGGPPVAVARDALFLVDEGTIYRLPRDDIVGLGQTRATDHGMMRWGVALYLLALPMMVLPVLGLGLILAGLMAIGGGVLVTLGFLSKALLIQVDDDRLPPFVVDHRKWKRIRSQLRGWV